MHIVIKQEVMSSMNRSVLDAYKLAGCKEVIVYVSPRSRKFSICGKEHMKIYSMKKPPNLPFHPNCRCTIVPDDTVGPDIKYNYDISIDEAKELLKGLKRKTRDDGTIDNYACEYECVINNPYYKENTIEYENDKIGNWEVEADKIKCRKIKVKFEVRAQRSLSHLTDKELIFLYNNDRAPINSEGQKLQLHHHLQNEKVPIIEMPQNLHSLGNKKQHPYGNSGGVGSGEVRGIFDKWRKVYWKTRYIEELRNRGE